MDFCQPPVEFFLPPVKHTSKNVIKGSFFLLSSEKIFYKSHIRYNRIKIVKLKSITIEFSTFDKILVHQK